MPTYQYRCTECGTDLEAVQKFSDDPLTECPTCGGALRKVYSAVGVVFKGSGFYATDNRTKGSARAAVTAGAKSDTTSESKPAKHEGKSESKHGSKKESPKPSKSKDPAA